MARRKTIEDPEAIEALAFLAEARRLKMTPKQLRFFHMVLAGGLFKVNRTAAYIAAGYRPRTRESAWAGASRCFRDCMSKVFGRPAPSAVNAANRKAVKRVFANLKTYQYH